MFELETDRLRLIPLTYDMLKLCLDDYPAMEAKLGLIASNVDIGRPVRQVMLAKLQRIEQDRIAHGSDGNFVWLTYWQIVLKPENRAIGLIGFKGKANESNEVEIGYGLQPAYHNQGYMTETVQSIVDWALTQDTVEAVVAETLKSNLASQSVLQKAGMIFWYETRGAIWWRRSLGE